MRVYLLLLLAVQLVTASHMRALWFQWTRATVTDPDYIPINAVITSAWRYPMQFSAFWQYAMGNGKTMVIQETARGISKDSTGLQYSIVTQQGDWSGYEEKKRYTVTTSDCCRIGGLANPGADLDQAMDQHIYVDLSDENNPGSPQTNIPVIKQIALTGGLVNVPLSIVSLPGETGSLSFSLCDLDRSGISGHPPIVVNPTTATYDFDTSGLTQGDRFAACIQVSDDAQNSGDTMMLDFLIDLVDPVRLPTAVGDTTLTANVGQPVTGKVTATNPQGGTLSVGVTLNPPTVANYVTITAATGETITSAGETTIDSGVELTVTFSPDSTTADTGIILIKFTEQDTFSSADWAMSILVRPDIDCEYEWDEWSTCSSSCGGDGTQQRNPIISQAASGNGVECPAPEQQDCNRDPCVYTCTVGGLAQEKNPDETCRTCRINIDANEQCGTCYRGYVVDEIDWTCKPAACGDNGEQWAVADDDGYKYLTSCRQCEHGKTNSPINSNDTSCSCSNYDSRALVQPAEAFLITEESEPAAGLSYTKLDQSIAFIMFEESSSILRGEYFGAADFDLIDANGNKASDTCKNKFIWDFNPDSAMTDVNSKTGGQCPDRRQVLGRIKLIDLMTSECGTRTPPVSEAEDGVLTVTVRFVVNGKRWVRPQDDEEGSLVNYYLEQNTVTAMPLQYRFPLSVTVETTPGTIYNAASSTYLRVEIDVGGGLVAGTGASSPLKTCETLRELALSTFDDPASVDCDFRTYNAPDAYSQSPTDAGYFTVKVNPQESNLVDDLCGSDIISDDKCSAPDSRVITFQSNFEDAYPNFDIVSFNGAPHAAFFAPRAVTGTEILDVATPGKDPKAKITLTMTIDHPFYLTTPVAPWEDDRFPFTWMINGDECSTEDECNRDFILTLYDEPNDDGARACTFSGTYTVAFAVKCRVAFLQGGGECPIQPNYLQGGMPVVEVEFRVDTGNHCPTLAGVVYLDAAMWSYSTDVGDEIDSLGTYLEYVKPVGNATETFVVPDTDRLKAAFINNQYMYFRAQVRSDEAGLATAKFTVVKIVPVNEDGTDDVNAITFLFDEKQGGITQEGESVGFEMFTSADTSPAAAKSDQSCRQGTNADCWLMPRFQLKANVNVEVNNKLVFNVPRRSNARFKFEGTIAVTYSAGGIGTRRRLLDFSLPRRSMLQEAAAPTDQEVPAATEASVDFEQDFDQLDPDAATAVATATEAEYGDEGAGSKISCSAAVLAILALAVWY